MTVKGAQHTMNRLLRVHIMGHYIRWRWPAEIIGEFPMDEPYVFAVGPHKTGVETVVLPAHARAIEMHIMAKAGLFKYPVFGWVFRKAGGIPVPRRKDGGNPAMSAALAVAEILKGFVVLNYVEGTRYPEDDFLHKGSTGPVRIALDAGCKILLGGLVGMLDGEKREIRLADELFDPQAELEDVYRTSPTVITRARAIRIVTDRLCERLAELAEIEYRPA